MTELKNPSSAYREEARLAREKAERVLSPHFKRKWLEIAATLDKLADEEAERGD